MLFLPDAYPLVLTLCNAVDHDTHVGVLRKIAAEDQ